MKRGVIYTTITGHYDFLYDHTYKNLEYDYICFTDDLNIASELSSSWKIRPLTYDKCDNVRNQRWHKVHPHLLFPEYTHSLWVDANMDILTKDIFEKLTSHMQQGHLIAASIHPKRNCVYREMDACRKLEKDNLDVINAQEKKIRDLKFPRHEGLFETGLLFRSHNDKNVKDFSEIWWNWIEMGSARDQLSFTVVAWLQDVNIHNLSNDPYNTLGNSHLRILPHIPQLKSGWDALAQKYLHTEEVLRKKEGWLKSVNARFEVRRGEKIRKFLRRNGLF